MQTDHPQALKVHAVVARVLTDTAFADQLKADGLAALKSGAGSKEWATYFEHFAPHPGALAAMGTTQSASCTCNSATWTTLSTIVTPVPTCCGATTTTTTSGS
jgi:hypothetical protein